MGKTLLPDPRRTPRFAGLITFGRYPRLEDVAKANRPIDWIIYGVPYDGGVTYRPGARFGPRAIRAESQYLKRYSIEHDLDLCDSLSLADAGDAPVWPYSPRENLESATRFATSLPGGGPARRTRLLALGGDHSVALANLRATWERQGRPRGGLGLVHFDSHLDTVDRVWNQRWGHASVLRRAIEEGLVDPRRMISLGIKGPLNAAGDLEYLRRRGATVLTFAALNEQGRGILDDALPALAAGRRPVYVTFDIDCVDPAFAPGTGTPSVGGFSSSQVLSLVRSLAGMNIVGADVVEVLPDRDPQGITALLAAHVAFEILCAAAGRRGAARGSPARKPRLRRAGGRG